MSNHIDTTVRAADFYGTGGYKVPLPEGVEHGSARAVTRFGCGCPKCQDRASRMRNHGYRPRP